MDTTSQVHQQQRRGGSTNQVRTEAANENVQLWIPRKSGLQFSHSFLFLRRVLPPPSFPFFFLSNKAANKTAVRWPEEHCD